MSDVKVFVSYSWSVEKQTGVVGEIQSLCPARGIAFIRDESAMQHGDVIMDFMDDLTSGDHIITVFSKPYFKSPWCMYELLQIMQKGGIKERTHPVIADDCNLQEMAYRIEIVKYWTTEHEKIKGLLDGVDPALIGEEYKEANRIRDIAQNVSDLMSFAKGRLTTPLADLRAKEFSQILDKVRKPVIAATETTESDRAIKEVIVLDSGNARRIKQLEEQITSIEETLHNYELELVDAYHHAQKSSLKKDIKEKKELLSGKYHQYELLIKGLDQDAFNEEEARLIVAELVEMTDNEPAGLATEIKDQLAQIRQEIQDQSKSATAKLKVALPIIPGLASYELEVDTDKFLGEVWGKVRSLLKKKADQANP